MKFTTFEIFKPEIQETIFHFICMVPSYMDEQDMWYLAQTVLYNMTEDIRAEYGNIDVLMDLIAAYVQDGKKARIGCMTVETDIWEV